jgi:hypothetical protein
MHGFKQYIEALSSHGGFYFAPKDADKIDTWPNEEPESISKKAPWEFPDFTDDHYKIGYENERKTFKHLSKTYKDIIAKLDERLLKLNDFNFHIYFGLPKDIDQILMTAHRSREDVTKRSESLLQDLFFSSYGLNIPKNDIVFVKTGPSGDILTPWMTLHVIGHSLLSDNELRKKMIAPLNKFFSDNYPPYGKHRKHRLMLSGKETMSCLFNFRSARTMVANKKLKVLAALNDDNELLYELVASYLWNGGHIARPTEPCLKFIYHKKQVSARINNIDEEDIESYEEFTSSIENMFADWDNAIHDELEKSRGKVLVDFEPYPIQGFK